MSSLITYGPELERIAKIFNLPEYTEQFKITYEDGLIKIEVKYLMSYDDFNSKLAGLSDE